MFRFSLLLVLSIQLLHSAYSQSTTATGVYGQLGSFTANSGNNPSISSTSLQVPTGLTLDSSENLYVADTGNNRVLYYLKGSMTATRVYGQGGSFTTNTVNNGGVTANSLGGPTDIAVDSGNGVYIADTQNNRVLFYLSGSTTATRVYGQSGSFITNTANNGGISANSLSNPNALTLDSAGNLYVSDSRNNRVLVYSSGSTAATTVYGQAGLFNGAGFTPITASSLNTPTDLSLDSSGNLYIADDGNSRILFYLVGSTTATRVYGQAGSFTSGATGNPGGVTANTLSQPRGVTVSSSNVYIADTGNYRVLGYSGSSTTATTVYGQLGSFTSNSANNGGVSANSLNLPYRLAKNTLTGNVYIADGANNRVLLYSASSTTSSGTSTTSPANTGGSCFHTSTIITYKGKDYTFGQLQNGAEKECVIPHVVKSQGLKLTFHCMSDLSTERMEILILTPDHLIFLREQGFVPASSNPHGYGYSNRILSNGREKNCAWVSSEPIGTGDYFGLNCLESTVHANSILTSTFGYAHHLPSYWMSVMGRVVGIEKASAWGDRLAAWWMN